LYSFSARVQIAGSKERPPGTRKIVIPTPESAIAIVLTSIGSDADAAALAHTLIDERLAACVSIVPTMMSVYRWNGTIEHEREQQLVIKTTPERVAALQTRLGELHSYDLPEFIVLTGSASLPYLEWVRGSVRPISFSD
jgi:periplasmic divalent cation tolerance protein